MAAMSGAQMTPTRKPHLAMVRPAVLSVILAPVARAACDIRPSAMKPSTSNLDTRSIVMSCDVIKAVLNGNGRCKIFHGVRYNIHPAVNFYLGYQCDGGKIGGPTDARID